MRLLLPSCRYTIITDKIVFIDNLPTHVTINFTSHPSIDVPHLLVFPTKNTPCPHAIPLLTPSLLGGPLSSFGTIPNPNIAADAAMPMPRMGDSPKTPVKGLFWAGNSGSFVANVQASCAQGMNAAIVAGEELGGEDMEEMLREMKERRSHE